VHSLKVDGVGQPAGNIELAGVTKKFRCSSGRLIQKPVLAGRACAENSQRKPQRHHVFARAGRAEPLRKAAATCVANQATALAMASNQDFAVRVDIQEGRTVARIERPA
jgi:hypothetical protein